MVVMAKLSAGAASARVRAAAKNCWGSSLRQRNALVFVGDMREPAALPVLFGLLDTLFAGRDKIPPDMARTFQRVATEKHHPGGSRSLYGNPIAGPEDHY